MCITITFYHSGVTHKKTIIEYCENKIKKAVVSEEMVDRASYILLYELMIMLIQQNGVSIIFFKFSLQKVAVAQIYINLFTERRRR